MFSNTIAHSTPAASYQRRNSEASQKGSASNYDNFVFNLGGTNFVILFKVYVINISKMNGKKIMLKTTKKGIVINPIVEVMPTTMAITMITNLAVVVAM